MEKKQVKAKYLDMWMWEYQQASSVHEPKDMRMWGCEDTNKHPDYLNVRTQRCEDARLPARIQGTTT